MEPTIPSAEAARDRLVAVLSPVTDAERAVIDALTYHRLPANWTRWPTWRTRPRRAWQPRVFGQRPW